MAEQIREDFAEDLTQYALCVKKAQQIVGNLENSSAFIRVLRNALNEIKTSRLIEYADFAGRLNILLLERICDSSEQGVYTSSNPIKNAHERKLAEHYSQIEEALKSYKPKDELVGQPKTENLEEAVSFYVKPSGREEPVVREFRREEPPKSRPF